MMQLKIIFIFPFISAYRFKKIKYIINYNLKTFVSIADIFLVRFHIYQLAIRTFH
jgi:hypothetical protein